MSKSLYFAAIVMLASLFSQMALACPNIEGTYLCKQNDYRRDTLYTFEQSLQQGVWKFTMVAQPIGREAISKFQFLADGIERELVDQIAGTRLIAKASCDSREVTITGEAGLDQPKRIRFMEVLSRTPAGHLSNVSLDINGKTVQEICQRI